MHITAHHSCRTPAIRFITLLLLLFTAGISIIPVQALSPGCMAIDGQTRNVNAGASSYLAMANLVAGESITVTITGNAIVALLDELDTLDTADTTATGTGQMSHTFPADEIVRAGVNNAGAGNIVADFACGVLPVASAPAAGGVDDDPDGDGILSSVDNCSLVPNPDQADNWSGPAGDACDDEYYEARYQPAGMAGYPMKNGWFGIWGFCRDTCAPVGSFYPPDLLNPANFTDAGTLNPAWSGGLIVAQDVFPDVVVIAFYLYDDAAGNPVYQFNVIGHYASGSPLLLDDGVTLTIFADGSGFQL